MVKKATIIISLVKESSEKMNVEIEKEIFKELSAHPTKIPWMKKVEKVKVTEE
jgi:DNA-directed RNA polymerase subunit H (RpoH/RPB5)